MQMKLCYFATLSVTGFIIYNIYIYIYIYIYILLDLLISCYMCQTSNKRHVLPRHFNSPDQFTIYRLRSRDLYSRKNMLCLSTRYTLLPAKVTAACRQIRTVNFPFYGQSPHNPAVMPNIQHMCLSFRCPSARLRTVR